MNLYLLALQTLLSQLQISLGSLINSLLYLNPNQTRDLWQNGIICQQKDYSLLADRFEPLIYSFAIKLTVSIVT
jgi:hypothetical protein